MPRSITVTGLPFTNFSKIGWSMIPGLLANSRRDRDTHSLWRAAATFKGLTYAPKNLSGALNWKKVVYAGYKDGSVWRTDNADIVSGMAAWTQVANPWGALEVTGI